jgi:4-methyl-5(b-hydroxyethyl)-thiazole monophosphate biosynthesis
MHGLQVDMSRHVKLVADKSIQDAAQGTYDAIALPGGMPGAERLGQCKELLGLLEKQRESGRIWSAICATPAVVFEAQGWLKGKKATSHPAFVDRLADDRCGAPP